MGETVKHGNSLREHSGCILPAFPRFLGQTGTFPIFVGGFPERLNLFYPWDVLFNYWAHEELQETIHLEDHLESG